MMDKSNEGMERCSLPLDLLQPFSKNAVTHNSKNKEAIRNSLEKFGQYHDLIVLKENHEVIIGNGRLEVMKELGWTEASCRVYDM
ncbi:MAG: ParB N-terminal domain-containing protein, partial [Lentisphaeraceae bacterium]|nr:ParB N-terminal domain-containing protein [Lentisphaeraceae bacterium]